MKKIICIFVAASLFGACASKNATLATTMYDSPPVSYHGGAETQIRQSVKISFKGKEFSFQGVVTFRDGGRVVRAAALTGFGIKIFELEYNAGDETFFYLNKAFGNIPYFAEAIRHTVRRLYIERFGGTLISENVMATYAATDWIAHVTRRNDGIFQVTYNNFHPSFTVTIVDIEISGLE